MGTSEYIYDQCGYNPQSSDDQSNLLRASAAATAASSGAAVSPAELSGDDVLAATADFEQTLGFEQMWCGARQGAQVRQSYTTLYPVSNATRGANWNFRLKCPCLFVCA